MPSERECNVVGTLSGRYDIDIRDDSCHSSSLHEYYATFAVIYTSMVVVFMFTMAMGEWKELKVC